MAWLQTLRYPCLSAVKLPLLLYSNINRDTSVNTLPQAQLAGRGLSEPGEETQVHAPWLDPGTLALRRRVPGTSTALSSPRLWQGYSRYPPAVPFAHTRCSGQGSSSDRQPLANTATLSGPRCSQPQAPRAAYASGEEATCRAAGLPRGG